jgi:hypothetical protein
MEQITKTISRSPDDRKSRLILAVDRYAFLSVLALPIIAGLEMYYQNRYGDPDTTYIGGCWTLVYGISWFIAFRMRRASPKKLVALMKAQGRNVEESVTFSNEGFGASVTGYFTSQYAWASLSSFTDAKRHLRFTVAGIEFMLSKKHFTPAELEQIKQLLNQERQSLNKSVQNDEERAAPPPLPRT